MKKNKILNIVFLSIIFILCVYGCIENYIFLKKDNSPFIYDLRSFYDESGEYYKLIKNGNLAELRVYFFNEYFGLQPPFLLFQPIPFYFLLGFNEDAAALSNIIHIFILLFSSYFIGKKLFNEYVGFISSLILFFLPGFLPFSRVFLQDFALASFVNLSIALFLYSDNLEKRSYTFFLGASLGIGMLTKLTFPIYILPFSILILLNNFLKRKKSKKNQPIINIVILILVLLAIALPWYFTNFEDTLAKLNSMNNYIKIKHFSDIGFVDSLILIVKGYVVQLYDVLLKDFLFLTILCSIFILCKIIGNSKIKKEIIILSLGLGFSFLGLLFTPPNPRYLLPFLLLISIIIASGIFDFFVVIYKRQKIVKFDIAFLLCAVFFLLILFGYKECVKNKNNTIRFSNFYDYGLVIPEGKITKNDEINEFIKNKMSYLAGNKILILSNTENAVLLSNRLRFENNYSVDNPLFCLTMVPWIKNISSCRTDVELFSRYYDLVLDYNINIDNDSKRIVEEIPERRELVLDIISKWETYKKNYFLVKSFTDNRLAKNENLTLFIYEKKKN